MRLRRAQPRLVRNTVPPDELFLVAAGMAAGHLGRARRILVDGEWPAMLLGTPAVVALEHLASAAGWLQTAAKAKP
jgi:hypothetical protein